MDLSIDDIITIPNPVLRQRSQRIGHIDSDIVHLAEEMIRVSVDWENSREHEFTAALAAVQVAKPFRLIVVRDDFDNKDNHAFSVYLNPEIVRYDGEPVEELEGCLSVADIYGSVLRYPRVKIKALNLEGKPVRLTANGFLARVFQHEIDHTNGMVFVDRITDPSKLFRLEANGSFSALAPETAKTALDHDHNEQHAV